MQAWCKVCYLWICVVCVVARMGPGVQRTKKNTPSGTFVLHRISNPENLLGRQKCYPYTNGVFFARSTDGCAAMRAAIGQICSISTVQRENPTTAFLSVHYTFINGDDRLLAADCSLRTVCRRTIPKAQRALAVSRAACDDQQ